jgi:RNA polymerase sigma-70 factor (ECF subfamily)
LDDLAIRVEHDFVRALRAGDEQAFAHLVDTYSPAMQRLALTYVHTRAVAEEVVQETWLALLHGIDAFEERSSIKTWLFRILVNIARKHGIRERRSTPFSDLSASEDEGGPTVDPSRFATESDTARAGHWLRPPRPWDELPETHLTCRETIARIQAALTQLPERQRMVVVLRDVEGFSAEEVCGMLGLSVGNQRVLLHRGRARVREILENYLDGER